MPRLITSGHIPPLIYMTLYTGITLILCPQNQTEVRGSVDGISAAYSGKQVIFWA
jgi:hypothetical protein